MDDSFLKTHYKFSQIVKVATRRQAILDQIWTNMNMVHSKPVTVAELGTSDHNMVLLKPSSKMTLDRAYWQYDNDVCKEYGCKGKGNI